MPAYEKQNFNYEIKTKRYLFELFPWIKNETFMLDIEYAAAPMRIVTNIFLKRSTLQKNSSTKESESKSDRYENEKRKSLKLQSFSKTWLDNIFSDYPRSALIDF